MEAWQYEDKPWLYAILRRYELLRWVCRHKQLASFRARLRATLLVLRGHETEICSECGGAVGVVWWCDDNDLWERITGEQDGGGVWCVQCFDNKAVQHKVYLRWKVTLL
jgi:hypothetical protein